MELIELSFLIAFPLFTFIFIIFIDISIFLSSFCVYRYIDSDIYLSISICLIHFSIEQQNKLQWHLTGPLCLSLSSHLLLFLFCSFTTFCFTIHIHRLFPQFVYLFFTSSLIFSYFSISLSARIFKSFGYPILLSNNIQIKNLGCLKVFYWLEF